MPKKPVIPFWLCPFSWGTSGAVRETLRAKYELTGEQLDRRILEIESPTIKQSIYQQRLIDIDYKYNKITEVESRIRHAKLLGDPYDRDKAIINATCDGLEREVKILELNHKHGMIDEHTKNHMIVMKELESGKITENEFLKKNIELIKDPKTKAIAVLELKLKLSEVTQMEYDKQLATLNGQPWVSVLNMSFDKTNPNKGVFELDWNEQFVEQLKSSGYIGRTPDEIVDLWFMNVCKNVAMDEFGGVGSFDETVAANFANKQIGDV